MTAPIATDTSLCESIQQALSAMFTPFCLRVGGQGRTLIYSVGDSALHMVLGKANHAESEGQRVALQRIFEALNADPAFTVKLRTQGRHSELRVTVPLTAQALTALHTISANLQQDVDAVPNGVVTGQRIFPPEALYR